MARTQTFAFKVVVQAIMEHKEGSATSKSKQVEMMLYPSPNLDKRQYLTNGEGSSPTEAGSHAITMTLVQGLVANIHQAHQLKTIDSAAHLRKIISMLEDGFIQQAETKPGSTFTDINSIHD